MHNSKFIILLTLSIYFSQILAQDDSYIDYLQNILTIFYWKCFEFLLDNPSLSKCKIINLKRNILDYYD